MHGGLLIIDITDPTNPQEVGFCDAPRIAWDVAVVGDYAYVADFGRGISVISISNPESPEEVSRYDGSVWYEGLCADDEYLYLADGEEGLRIIDISDPENPSEEGYCYTHGWASNVTVDGNYAYVADGTGGLFVADVTNRGRPRRAGYFDTPGFATNVSIVGDLVYVADKTSLEIYRNTLLNVENDAKDPSVREFKLLFAHPNPFNSTSTVKYSLSTASHISLELYNPLGQRVMMLYEGQQQSGNYSTILIADDLLSGLYFIKLSANYQSSTKKIILIK
ncbi:MAG: T9SS type A sorting domain-containing protein [Candidatus Hatepunaea meridiana]|nr:T9SS type A sorting domain-containing protein [Candidatus Hatepunaea meridiana]